jgi:hypothetical protein
MSDTRDKFVKNQFFEKFSDGVIEENECSHTMYWIFHFIPLSG